jgi:hypothetical protein
MDGEIFKTTHPILLILLFQDVDDDHHQNRQEQKGTLEQDSNFIIRFN